MVNPCFLIWIDMYIKKPQNTYFPPPIALTVNCESLPESQSHIEYSENGLYQLESFHIPNLLLKPLLVQSEYTFSKISWPQVVYVNVLIQLASLYAELTHKRNIYLILFRSHHRTDVYTVFAFQCSLPQVSYIHKNKHQTQISRWVVMAKGYCSGLLNSLGEAFPFIEMDINTVSRCTQQRRISNAGL